MFAKWEMMNAKVDKVLRQNKNLYSLFFKTEKLFNEFNDFFCLKEILVYNLMDYELNTIAFKRVIKKFLKIKLQELKQRKIEEEKEEERIRAIWEDDITLVDDQFPF